MFAPREVVPFLINLVKPKNVLDVGCGTGTWLKAFEEAGISDYIGVDGDHLDKGRLEIPQDKFYAINLCKKWKLNRKFDLVLSLEVAEHLPEENADSFVEALVTHGDTIVFSAAIPGQDGQYHLNEQWPQYWQTKFLKHGFYFHDVIRPLIWDNKKIDWWYRQNMFLLNKQNTENFNNWPISIVHPELLKLAISNREEYYVSLVEGRQGLKLASIIFFNSLKFKIKSILGIV
jgi:SAM-dependent methyltransferase